MADRSPLLRRKLSQAMDQLGNEVKNKKEWEAFRGTHDHGKFDDVDEVVKFIQIASESQPDTRVKSVFNRVLERLHFFSNFANAFFEPAPETVKLVWFSFKALLTIVGLGSEGREFVSVAMEQVSEWLVVAAVYAEQFKDAVSVQEKIPPLLKTLLQLTFEVWKSGYHEGHHEPEPAKTNSSTEEKLAAFRRFLKKAKGHLRALAHLLMGKIEELKTIIKAGNWQLHVLQRDGKFAFQNFVREHLKQHSLDVNRFASLLETTSESFGKVQADLDRAAAGLVTLLDANTGYERMHRWLCLGTPLHPDEPLIQLRGRLNGSTTENQDWTESESKHWIDGPKRLCWLSGSLGVGKSYTTSLIIDKLLGKLKQPSGDQPLVIYFFCQVGTDATQKTRKILLHLLLQLYEKGRNTDKQAACAREVERAKENLFTAMNMDHQPESKDTTDGVLSPTTLQSLILRLIKIMGRDTFVIVDALDECDDRAKLMTVLKEMAEPREEGATKVWVSSRNEFDIRRVLQPSTDKNDHFLHISAEEKSIEGVLHDYVGRELRGMTYLNKAQRGKAKHAVTKLPQNFLHMSMAISVLKGPKAIENFGEVLSSLSHKTNVLYQQRMDDLTPDVRKWFTIALRWLICGKEEVTEDLIADDIENTYSANDERRSAADGRRNGNSNIERPSIAILKRQARDLLRFDSQRKVHLMHTTMRDWVEDEGKRDGNEERDGVSRCQTCAQNSLEAGSIVTATTKHGSLFMAAYIMKVLSNKNFRKRYISRRKDNDRLRYELIHWHYHVRLAETEWPESGWPEGRRENGQYGDVWKQLYEDIDHFLEPGPSDFRTWFKRAHPGHFRKDSDTKLYYAAFFGLLGTMERHPKVEQESWLSPLRAVCLGRGSFVGLEFVVEQLVSLQNKPGSSENGIQPVGVLLNDRDPWYATPVMMLIDHNAPPEKIEFLHSKGARLDQLSKEGSSSLHYAVRMQMEKTVKFILDLPPEERPCPDARDKLGETPLHRLLKLDDDPINKKIAKLLLDKGANINAKDDKDQQPLFEAARTGNTAVAKMFLEHKEKPEINHAERSNGFTALHAAVSRGNLEFFKLLVNAGAELTPEDSKHRTPLALAAEIGRSDIIEAILKHRHDEDKKSLCGHKNKHGTTPLHLASKHGHVKCAKLLLEGKCNANAEDKKGMTPLDLASEAWMKMIPSLQNLHLGEKLEETIDIIMGYQPRLTEELFFRILNVALERNSQGIMGCIRRYVRFETDRDDNGGGGQIRSGSGRWSLLSLAVQYQEHGLLDCLIAEDTVPLAWDVHSSPCVLVVSQNGQDVSGSSEENVSHSDHFGAVRTSHPIAPGQKQFYFEITMRDNSDKDRTRKPGICIGFCSQFFDTKEKPGSLSTYNSWGYHSDDGKYSNGSRDEYGEEFTTQDAVVGARVDFEEKKIFFTKKGKLMGTINDDKIKGKLFPVVYNRWNEVKIRANFGETEEDKKKFMYKPKMKNRAVGFIRPVPSNAKSEERSS